MSSSSLTVKQWSVWGKGIEARQREAARYLPPSARLVRLGEGETPAHSLVELAKQVGLKLQALLDANPILKNLKPEEYRHLLEGTEVVIPKVTTENAAPPSGAFQPKNRVASAKQVAAITNSTSFTATRGASEKLNLRGDAAPPADVIVRTAPPADPVLDPSRAMPAPFGRGEARIDRLPTPLPAVFAHLSLSPADKSMLVDVLSKIRPSHDASPELLQRFLFQMDGMVLAGAMQGSDYGNLSKQVHDLFNVPVGPAGNNPFAEQPTS
jgi:hypothetical protein